MPWKPLKRIIDELRLGYSIMVGERQNCYHVAGDMRMALNIVGSETEKDQGREHSQP